MSVERSGLPALRSYQSWIANETLEHYSLRFAAKSCSLPIAYYSSKYKIDMDLLTRGAGFGYIALSPR